MFLTVGENVSTTGLARTLGNLGIGPVADKTNLQGRYDLRLTFDREIITAGKAAKAPTAEANKTGSGPSLFIALEEQLGLRLVPERVQMRYLVIDSAEKPSEN